MSVRKKIIHKTLKEQFAVELGYQSNQNSNLNSMDVSTLVLEPWMNESYCELMAVTAMLQGLYTLAQNFHWKASGKNYYSDHSLLQRIYEEINPLIDSVGEKAVGLGASTLANPSGLLKASRDFVGHVLSNDLIARGSDSETDKMFRQLGYAVTMFIETTEGFMRDMEKKGSLTKGIDNLLAGILDTHETFLYILKQRTEHTGF